MASSEYLFIHWHSRISLSRPFVNFGRTIVVVYNIDSATVQSVNAPIWHASIECVFFLYLSVLYFSVTAIESASQF